MEKRIWIKYGERAKLMGMFKTSYQTVHDALVYKNNSELAKRIRHAAVKQFGGVEVEY